MATRIKSKNGGGTCIISNKSKSLHDHLLSDIDFAHFELRNNFQKLLVHAIRISKAFEIGDTGFGMDETGTIQVFKMVKVRQLDVVRRTTSPVPLYQVRLTTGQLQIMGRRAHLNRGRKTIVMFLYVYTRRKMKNSFKITGRIVKRARMK